MQIRRTGLLLSAFLVVMAVMVAVIWWRFDSETTAARARAADASVIAMSRFGYLRTPVRLCA
jgi:hypothetical protein